ncbi:MAG TPA: hypothetical protein VGW33_08835 [Terriglobia bacterium]|nr:hypothetical protein [Terriglobia bacterium]
MANIRERYTVDKFGRRVVHLDITDCKDLLQEVEAEESVRAYDAAKSAGDEAVAFDAAVEEIESAR